MARVTVEDCIEKVKNRFELVLMASKRAKDLERGSQPSIPKDNDKATIIALREIAEETISLEGLTELTKRSLIEDNSNTGFINANPEDELQILADLGEDVDEDDLEDLDDEDLEALEAIDSALDEDEEDVEDTANSDSEEQVEI